MKFRGSRASKSGKEDADIDICSRPQLQTCRIASLSTLSSDSVSDDQMQNENYHHGAHGDQPSSFGKDVANGRKQNIQPMKAIKIVNKSLRKNSGKQKGGSSTAKASWCRPMQRKEGKVETRKEIAGAEWDKKLTAPRITCVYKQKPVRKFAINQYSSNGLQLVEAGIGDNKENMSSAIGHGAALNITKGYLV